MKILLVGDTHANISIWRNHIFHLYDHHEIDHTIQLGDFGYFPHVDFGKAYISKLNDLCDKHKRKIHFVDGNHEDHDSLEEIETAEDGFRHITENIFHLPRGHFWNWAGVDFLALGGAYSIDKPDRLRSYNKRLNEKLYHLARSIQDVELYEEKKAYYSRKFKSWWPQETITDLQIEHALTNAGAKADVVLTHDVFDTIDINAHFIGKKNMFLKWDIDSNNSRLKLERLYQNLNPKPKFWAHGHYHFRYKDTTEEGCKVLGLSHDDPRNFNDMWAIFDTDRMDII